jgi:hypothetical protein
MMTMAQDSTSVKYEDLVKLVNEAGASELAEQLTQLRKRDQQVLDAVSEALSLDQARKRGASLLDTPLRDVPGKMMDALRSLVEDLLSPGTYARKPAWQKLLDDRGHRAAYLGMWLMVVAAVLVTIVNTRR